MRSDGPIADGGPLASPEVGTPSRQPIPAPRSHRLKSPLISVAAIAAVAAGALAAGLNISSSDASTPNLAAVVLRSSQVGPGYTRHVLPNGRTVVGQVTLDLCGASYPSEAQRTARLQVEYVHPQPAPTLSNEVVSYRPGGTQEAIAELNRAAKNCPSTVIPVGGTSPVTAHVTRIVDRRLLPGYVAVQINARAVVQGKERAATVATIYQIHGQLLSAIYAVGTDIPITRRLAIHAAEQSAHDLG